jgi:hypothetical protein
MEKVQSKEIARRGNFFKSRGFDPGEVKLILCPTSHSTAR